MFVIKADAWFAPAEHCLCIPAWQRIGIYHQNNPRNIHRIFKWLKTECVPSLAPPTPNCIQFCFMLLHRAAKTLEWCLPMINAGTYAGSSACSQKWNDLKWQCSESSRGRSFWRDMEIRDGRLERITFPLPLSMPVTYHLNFSSNLRRKKFFHNGHIELTNNGKLLIWFYCRTHRIILD